VGYIVFKKTKDIGVYNVILMVIHEHCYF